MVLKGDGVKKGDLLVSGFVIDEKDKPLYYHLQTKIIGEYTERICITQSYIDRWNKKLIKWKNRYLRSNFLNKCEIIDKDIKYEVNDKCLKVEVTYKIRGNIAEESKILIKEWFNAFIS